MKNKLECFHSTFLNQGKKYRNVIILNLCEDKVWSNGRTVSITYRFFSSAVCFVYQSCTRKEKQFHSFSVMTYKSCTFQLILKTSQVAQPLITIQSHPPKRHWARNVGLATVSDFFFFFKQLPVWNVSSTWSSDWGRNRCEENLRFSRFGMSCVCLVKEIKF